MSQAVHYRTEWMGGGAVQAGKAVTVRNIADTANATVYTSTAGTATGSNPVTTDSAGLFETYLAPGRYLLKDAAGDRLEITVATPGTDTPAVVPTAASAISFSPTGTVAATNVQAAVAEVASEATSAIAAIKAGTAITGVVAAGPLKQLLTALAAEGLIIDNTTAT